MKIFKKITLFIGNPSSPGKDMGSVTMELWILPVQDADMNPVGEERNEPNKEPFLEMPENGRSLADFMPGWR